jgi:hypothetical protein
MSNDDFGRQIIANGSLGATPSPYLYLTSTKIGYLINFFVKYNKLINWYYIYLIGNYLIFSTFIFFLILSNESKLSGKLIKLVLILAILLIAIMMIESTTIGILLAFLSFLYFQKYAENREMKFFVIGLCLFAYSLLIRIDIGFVFLAIYSLPLLYSFLMKGLKKEVLIIIVVALSLSVNFFLEQQKLSEVAGIHFNQFVKATENIIDNPNNIDDDKIAAAGFDSNSYELVLGFFFIDKDYFTYEKIILLGKNNRTFNDIKEIPYNLLIFAEQNWYFLMVFFISLFILGKGKKKKEINIITFLTFLLICLLTVFFRLPQKISFALVFSIITIRLFYGQFILSKSGFIGLVIIVVGYKIYFDKLREETLFKKEVAQQFIELLNNHPNLIFQTTRHSEITYQGFAGYSDKINNTQLNFLPFGWSINTPAYNNHLEYLNISNHFNFITSDARVRIISSNESFVDLIEEFSKNIYQKEISIERDKDFDEWPVYKVEMKKN